MSNVVRATRPEELRAGDKEVPMQEHSTAQRGFAEAIGTGLLVYVGAGSVPAILLLEGGSKAPFSGADLGMISFAFGLIVVAMIYTVGKVSGCHINPAVTFALAVTKRIPWREVPVYWCAQVIGAVIGALGIWAVFGHSAITLGMGMTSFNQHASAWGSAVFAEGIGTAVLMFTILGIVDSRSPGDLAGIVIGGVVIAIIMILGPITGASLNPARAFGPELVSALGNGKTFWDQLLPVYILPGLVGSGLAAVAYDFLAKPRLTVRPVAEAVTHPDPGPREPAAAR